MLDHVIFILTRNYLHNMIKYVSEAQGLYNMIKYVSEAQGL